ncbi:glycosyltransferase family 4 protein [Aequorivita sp. SDUM287046]|uniref:Glycosyltransferase family 4 protein n=1 Tax=Aequorivita aurantiaca TaxID=3053356 RepID=A0ABT8DJR4_9FLAO|nr:glycosyltransferase family 4 protein [Aequorivita aurantiaca]MDN3725293.1 glycosyltransferase family 4 protein [Aequorivita aurantiaca]
MRIIIFDGSFKTTPFIRRLIESLSMNNEIYILGFNEEIDNKFENVKYISLGSNQKKLRFITTALAFSFSNKSFSHFLKTLKLLFKKRRKDIQQQNFEMAVTQIDPDIIHVQWPSLMSWCEPFLLNKKYKIILSQRGSQTTILPFVDIENFEYLKKWYPKISGFHSVSKSISEKGNMIWNDVSKIDKVIYTGLPLERLAFSQEYSKSKPIKLLSVGRAHWVKGYDYALRSCRLLKMAGVNFHYTIIGGAGDEELQYLRKQLGLEELVSFKDRMPQDQVFELMKSASLLLVTSLAEGLPNVAVEAMAIGLPVISTDCGGGVTEIIEENCTGWIVPSRNALAMALVIERFDLIPLEEIQKIRLAARRKVESQHSEIQMVEGMEKLYNELIV